MIGLLILLVCGGFSLYALPDNFIGRQIISRSNFMGESINDIATNVIQGYDGNGTNFVFSPFGYSVILALLSEGARGETRNELVNALHLPEDVNFIRETYETTLSRMTVEKTVLNKPEFKNYFYVYKNFTVNGDYKDVLRKYYLTEVKSTDRPDDYEQDLDDESSQPIISSSPLEEENSGSEKTTTGKLHAEQLGTRIPSANLETIPSKPDTEKSTQKLVRVPENFVTEPTASPAEGSSLPLTGGIKEATEKAAELLSLEKDLAGNVQEGSSASKVRKERIKRLAKRFFGIDLDRSARNEVASLSANRLYSGKYNAKLSRMLIFNGLYFKGSWQALFQYKQTEDTFYLSETEKKPVRMVYSVGKFLIGDISDLDSVALRIPYKGERYSFLILMPNKRNGLSQLVTDLTGYSLRNIPNALEEKHVQVSIPTFDFKTISHMKEPLSKFGVNSIFSEKADLSGISSDSGLFVDDLVQLVTVNVDHQTGSSNFLTASSVSTRTVTEKFTVDHPFLFFIQDHKDDILVAAGKVVDPTVKED